MTINIKIFSDYIWGFCYVGKGVVDQLKKEYDIQEEWIGYEIHPETPSEGVSFVEMMGENRLNMMIDNFNNMAEPYGLKFGDLKVMNNSYNSLEAAEYARSVGKFEEYHEALLYVYFTEAKDIGNIEVLSEVGMKVGINGEELAKSVKEKRFAEKIKEDAQHAKNMGINSTPTFIINDEYKIVGAQSIEVFRNLFDSRLKNKGLL